MSILLRISLVGVVPFLSIFTWEGFMSKKHFETIARILREGKLSGVVTDGAIKFVCNELSRSNGRFDADRFLRACAVK